MKRIAILALCLAACGTRYQTARTTIFVGRTGMQFADGIFKDVERTAEEKCAKLDESSSAFTACVAPITKRRTKFDLARRNVYDGLDTSEKIVDAAEKANAKDFRTWIGPARAALCFLSGLLDWLPKKAQQNIIVTSVRTAAAFFAGGCKK